MKKYLSCFVLSLLIPISFLFITSCHSVVPIKPVSAAGFSSGGHEASKAIDGNINTYYETPVTLEANPSDDCSRRNIDFTFDGIYAINKLSINQFVNVEKYINTYNHYEIYASTQTDDWKKIAYKTNNDVATNVAETYHFKGVKAHIIRVNLSFNSWWSSFEADIVANMTCPLSEIHFEGYKLGKYKAADPLQISNWQDTKYRKEHDDFIDNSEYRQSKIISEIKNLVGRVLGKEYINSFVFNVNQYSSSNENDNFRISHVNNKVSITGNNGNALASGFNFYIKEKLFVDYNPMFSSHLINKQAFPPNNLPLVDTPIVRLAHYQYRYALNYCTYSYTMAFWTWNEWQKFLDWSAMNGINLMLDITGQEQAIRETLKDFNYTDDEAKQYICGPAYFAWFFMGNMTRYGGVLSDTWFYQRVNLARQIHELMQIYDIQPVFQGFGGCVPDDFAQHNPGAITHGASNWQSFQHTQDFLEPIASSGQRDYFQEFLSSYNNHLIDLFGDITHFRSADPFHEHVYPNYPPNDSQRAAIYVTIMEKWRATVGEDVVWLMQQWLNDVKQTDLQALKDNSFSNNVLVLDLQAEVSPNHNAMEQTQTPWIWSMINNFGGRMGIYGLPDNIVTIPPQTATHTGNPGNNYITGIGIAPESFGNSPFLYEFILDVNWMDYESRTPVASYINEYLERSYGTEYNLSSLNATDGAWSILLDTAYNNGVYAARGGYQGAPESVFNARPRQEVDYVSCWGGTNTGYNNEEFKNALGPFINTYRGDKDTNNSPNFIYDMADIARQCLQNWARDDSLVELANLDMTSAAYRQKANEFLSVMDLQDAILSKVDDWKLSNWINASRNMWPNMDDWDKDLFEFNARSLISTWAHVNPANGNYDQYNPQPDQNLRDYLGEYSNRQWSGLTKTIYKQRWQKYFDENCQNGTEYITNDWFRMEWEWVNQKSDEGFNFDGFSTPETLKDLAIQVLNLIS